MGRHLVRSVVMCLGICVALATSGQAQEWDDPTTETYRFTASDQAAGSGFGNPVTGDGDITVAGKSSENAAYVFRRDGSEWVEEQKVTGDGQLGNIVSISGNTFVMGARWDSEAAYFAGAVHVFTYDETDEEWFEDFKLLASDAEEGDLFGNAVAIRDDLIVVGAYQNDDEGDEAGAVYVFRYDDVDADWIEEQKLTASDAEASDFFGHLIALDGDILVVGAPNEDIGIGGQPGKAYVFRYDEDEEEFVEEQILEGSEGFDGDLFGKVAVQGNVIVVGAPVAEQAYVYRYDEDDDEWVEEAILEASDGEDMDHFGRDSSIDGGIIVVGAPNHGDAGAAYVYRYNGVEWVEYLKLIPDDEEKAIQFGRWVHAQEDVIFVGSPSDDDGGAVYAYVTDIDLGIEITLEPDSADLCLGDSVTMEVNAISPGPIAYQWRKDGLSLPGETGTTLQLDDVGPDDEAIYDVVIIDTEGVSTCDEILALGGSFTTPADAGITTVVDDLGFQPKAILFYGVATTEADVATPDSSRFIGFADADGNEVSMMVNAEDGNEDTWHSQDLDASLSVLLVGDDTPAIQATISSFDLGGFTLDFSATESDYIIHYVAFGGADLEATVGYAENAGAVVDGLPFEPTLIFTAASSQQEAWLGGNRSHFGYGVYAGGEQWALAMYQGRNDSVGVGAALQSDVAVAQYDGVETEDTVTIDSINDDGFDFSNDGDNLKIFAYLAMNTGDREVAAGTFAKETTGADGATQTMPELGFTPQIVGFTTAASLEDGEGNPDGCFVSQGVYDEENHFVNLTTQPIDTANTDNYVASEHAVVMADADAEYLAAGSFENLDFTAPSITWSPNNEEAYLIGYWALEVSGIGEVCDTVISPAAKLTVSDGPEIITHPSDLTVFTPEDATFSVVAEDTQEITYEWSYNGIVIPNSNSPALRIANSSLEDEGEYSVRVSSPCGDTESTVAVLTVVSHLFRRGDADGNGVIFPILDALFLLDYGFTGGAAPPCFDSADADDNGAIYPILDAILLFNYGFLDGMAPPDPGPETCGDDPTLDDLTCETANVGCD